MHDYLLSVLNEVFWGKQKESNVPPEFDCNRLCIFLKACSTDYIVNYPCKEQIRKSD